jgi:hypothetical protein
MLPDKLPVLATSDATMGCLWPQIKPKYQWQSKQMRPLSSIAQKAAWGGRFRRFRAVAPPQPGPPTAPALRPLTRQLGRQRPPRAAVRCRELRHAPRKHRLLRAGRPLPRRHDGAAPPAQRRRRGSRGRRRPRRLTYPALQSRSKRRGAFLSAPPWPQQPHRCPRPRLPRRPHDGNGIVGGGEGGEVRDEQLPKSQVLPLLRRGPRLHRRSQQRQLRLLRCPKLYLAISLKVTCGVGGA